MKDEKQISSQSEFCQSSLLFERLAAPSVQPLIYIFYFLEVQLGAIFRMITTLFFFSFFNAVCPLSPERSEPQSDPVPARSPGRPPEEETRHPQGQNVAGLGASGTSDTQHAQ